MKNIAALLLFLSPAHALYNGQVSEEAQGVRRFSVAIETPLGLCTGVVIAPKLIVTAGHCVAQRGKFKVHFLDEARRPHMAAVNRVALHPQFQEKNSFTPHDIGLIEVKISLETHLTPVKRAGLFNWLANDEPLTIVGFGSSERPNAKDGQLRIAKMLSAPPHIQGETFAGLKSSDEKAKVGMCTGDSGGAVMAGALLVGILKGGRPELNAQCTANPVYTPLKPYYTWIGQIAKRWGVAFD